MRFKIILILSVILMGAMSLGVVSATDNSVNNTNQTYTITTEVTQNHSSGLSYSPVDFSYLEGSIYQVEDASNFPTEYDLRTHGLVTPVKDQGPAGSCWSFAAYGSLESCLLPYDVEDFSENNMKNTLASSYPDGFDRTWDDGGWFEMSLAYLVRWSGPIDESDDPYNPYSGYSPPDLSPVKHIQDVTIIPPRTGPLDNDNLKWAIMNYGAVGSYMYMDDTFPYYNPFTHSYYYNSTSSGNHAICLVGWDDNYDRNNFTIKPPGNGAFIVKNSWGTYWGDNGYFYISYYDTKLGVKEIDEPGAFCYANFVFDESESTTNYNKNYQYDPFGWVGSMGYSDPTGWFSNVYISNGNDRLAAASFYVYSTNSIYELYVYLNPTTGNPSSGTLVSYKTGTLMPGYRTITLDSPISIYTGQIFSVVVKLTTPGYDFPIPIEYAKFDYSSHATSAPDQSYISVDGSYWEDFYWKGMTSGYSNANVCLKAFTIPEGIHVYPGDSIQDAINASSAGDYIFIHGSGGIPYIYTENLTVDHPLTIQSAGDGVVTVLAFNINQPVITITNGGNGCIIQGLIITGAANTSGMDLNSAYNCNIIGNTITGNSVGIMLYNSHMNFITGNTIQNNSWAGICLDQSSENTINGSNTITVNQEGIFIANLSNNNTINGNNIQNNDDIGIIILNNSNNNIIDSNTAISSNGMMGVFIQNSDYNRISGNIIQNNGWTGICLDHTDGNIINGSNTITGNQEGLNITNSNNNTINGNNITGNSNIGISIINSSTGNDITNNTTISNNGIIGVYIRDSDTNTVSGNTVQSNSWTGVCLDNATRNTINGSNNISDNLEGLYIVNNSNNNTITANNIHENADTGIYIDGSIGNIISGANTISVNGVIGILLRGANTNTISGNTLTGNNFAGIALDNANSNTINGTNIISGCKIGLYVTNNSNGNTVIGNTLQSNIWAGMVLDYAINTTVYNNNFNNNSLQALAQNGFGNAFYQSTNGNYWSDWITTNPRPVDGNEGIYDQYPSITPF